MDYTGTLGSRPCEKSLEQILSKISDPKVTHIVTRRLHGFREITDAIVDRLNSHPKYAKHLLRLCRNDALTQMKEVKDRMPLVCFTHWNACLVAIYRNSLKNLRRPNA